MSYEEANRIIADMETPFWQRYFEGYDPAEDEET